MEAGAATVPDILMPKNFNYYKMGAVAYLFINEPEKTVKEIADAVGIRENTVHQWQAKGEWDKALDAFNFTGDRSLRRKASRDLERESGDVIDLAKSTYRDARAAGMLISFSSLATSQRESSDDVRHLRPYSTGADGSD